MMCNHNILRSFLGHGPLTGCSAHVPKRNEKKKNERKKKLEKQIIMSAEGAETMHLLYQAY